LESAATFKVAIPQQFGVVLAIALFTVMMPMLAEDNAASCRVTVARYVLLAALS
jgi:hypothetical protein